MNKVRAHVIIRGFVQGVAFRYYTWRLARSLGVKGWVRNNPDGTVEAVFEGDEDAVREMLKFCHEGPPSARVDSVDVNYEPYRGEFDDFSITG